MGRLAVALAVALAPGAIACSIDDRTLTAHEPAILLLPDPSGLIHDSNAAGIGGQWTAFVDTPDCTASGFSIDQCSRIDGQWPGSIIAPVDLATGRMCISGTTAQVLNDPTTMTPAYGVMWGAGIQLQLTNAGKPGPYDAPAHMLTGFSFEIDAPPAGDMQVAFPTTTDASVTAYWGGKQDYNSPVLPGLNVVRFADVGGPFYSAAPPAFDPTVLVMLQFHVATVIQAPTPFDFCIWNLAARTD